MYLPFNEACMNFDFFQNEDDKVIDSRLYHFFQLLNKLNKKKLLDALVVFKDFDFRNNTFFKKWLEDPKRKKDERRWFYSFLERSVQYVDQFSSEEVFFDIDSKKYNSVGACCAVVQKKYGIVNVSSNSHWMETVANVCFRSLDGNCDIQESSTSVKQIYDDSQIEQLVPLNRSEKIKNISSGQDLWDQWEIFFPNLIKCGDVEKDLRNHPNKYHIDLVIKRLEILQNYFANKTKSFNLQDLIDLGLEVSNESRKTKELCKESHTFKLPDGKSELFWLHAKFNTDVLVRLHFLPKDMNYCYVAHIGEHLLTSSDVK